ncbi:hypothetical protein UT300007_08620 [Clostridium sp. CTA-7]
MKNIQDIMNEMNTLSEQIAVTLNNEEIVDGEIVDVEMSGDSAPCTTTDTPTNPPPCTTDNSPACANPQSRNVPFCCSTDLATNFHFNQNNPNARILYDLSCLNCFVDECCCNGTPRFDIKIAGTIPFIANADVVTGQPQQCVQPPNSTIRICCEGSVCVNNVVCNKCTEREAIIACELIKTKLANCACVPATVTATRGAGASACVLVFTGSFTLPNCNPPLGNNCNPA